METDVSHGVIGSPMGLGLGIIQAEGGVGKTETCAC